MNAYINRISTVVPPNDVHDVFIGFAVDKLAGAPQLPLFNRLARRSQIEHRWSVLAPSGEGGQDLCDVYRAGAFAGTRERMAVFERNAPGLAQAAVAGLNIGDPADITHLIVISCTGLSAPGLDLQLIDLCGLNPSVERTVVGFMGCYAAINGLKLARHIVRSEPGARILLVSVELCTLHLQDTLDLEEMLSFLIFGDGCAAALISADPQGLSMDAFKAVSAPGTADQITWNIGDQGFNMVLSGRVPASIANALRDNTGAVLGNRAARDISLWAVHPGGRSVLDAVELAMELPPTALATSREVLRRYGNMSSATILFVLEALLPAARPGDLGCAMAFGPGLTAETMMFSGAA
jgi:predicted naringenin-chalcone synthase